MNVRYFDKQGLPISAERWSALLHDRDYQVIKQTKGCGKSVSTVWLGLDHSHGTGDPVIFESMVFGADDYEDCVRYRTEEDALKGHERLCKKHVLILDLIVEAIERAENTMKIWTIQTESAHQKLLADGCLYGDWRRVDKDFKQPYFWLCDQMEQRDITLRGKCPIWGCFHKPDLRGTGFLPKGDRGVRLELEIPTDDCLVSNFGAWHCVLNDHYLSVDDEEMDKAFADAGGYTREEIKRSWERVFDTKLCADVGYGKECQVTFPSIRQEHIKKTTLFKAR